MQDPKHDQSRTSFQLDRFSFFSDGVFAIAITLLVIEIKVPELTEHTDHNLSEKLFEMSFKFLGFLFSFGIVGHYWSVHHRIFGYAKKYTTTLLWINLGYLLSVVILPFSSGLLGEYGTDMNMKVPYAFYVANMVLVGLMNMWIWIYISNPKRDLLTHSISRERIKLGVMRSLVVPIVFILSLLCSFILPLLSRFILLLIPIILHWGMGGIEKRANLKEGLTKS